MLGLLLADFSSGQTGTAAPRELATARAAFKAKLNERLSPLNRSYVAALRKTEKELASAGDYDGAIAARDERRAVEQMIIDASIREEIDPPTSPIPTPVSGSKPVVFAAAKAIPGGGATVSEGRGKMTGADGSLTWKLAAPIPGGHDVSVTYTCASTATFWVRENFFRLKGTVAAAESWKTVTLGQLKVTADADSITITGIDIPAEGLVFKEITLTANAD